MLNNVKSALGCSLMLIVFTLLELQGYFYDAFMLHTDNGKVIASLLASDMRSHFLFSMAHFSLLVVALHIIVLALWLGLTASQNVRSRLVGFFTLLAAIYLGNGLLVPDSESAKQILVSYGELGTLCLFTLCALISTWVLFFQAGKFTVRPLLVVAPLIVIVALPWQMLASKTTAPATVTKPNIFLIGIDSLRHDIVYSPLAEKVMPNFSNYYFKGQHYTNAFTPAARTFIAWSSILTQELPVESGVRVNLQDVPLATREKSIAYDLKNEGYSTLFAMDERRFSNVDQSWGFDVIVGPKAGVDDFVWGQFADIALLNMIKSTWVYAFLFPSLFNNRAVDELYDPEKFVDQIEYNIASMEAPLFAVTHFCRVHVPYAKRGKEANYDIHSVLALPLAAEETRFARYLEAARQVDLQFGQFMTRLEQRGLLQNAVVVLLSDHGESFSFDEVDLSVSGYTHGNNVLSVAQGRVPLSILKFKNGNLVSPSGNNSDLITLADVMSLTSAQINPASPIRKRKMVPLETGFVPRIMQYGGIKKDELIDEVSGYYRVNNNNELIVRDHVLQAIISTKQLAATDGEQLVARIWDESEQNNIRWSSIDLFTGKEESVDVNNCDRACELIAYVRQHFRLDKAN